MGKINDLVCSVDDRFRNDEFVVLRTEEWQTLKRLVLDKPVEEKIADNSVIKAIVTLRSEIERLGWDCADVNATLIVLNEIEEQQS